MCCLRGLTKKLQLQALDVFYAYKEVHSVVSILRGMRENSNAEFHQVFVEATKLGETLHGETFQPSMPHVAQRQVYRSNVDARAAEAVWLMWHLPYHFFCSYATPYHF